MKGANTGKQIVNCYICAKETPTAVVYDDNEIKIVRCSECGLMYQNPRLSEKQIQKISYQPNYFESHEKVQKRQREFFRSRFQDVFKNMGNGRVLDIGCGIGTFLSVVKDFGLEPYGVEVSKWACRTAREKWEINVFNGLLEHAGFDDNSFDIIHMSHVLEHCADPVSVLREVRRILKPKGILFVEVPYEKNFKIRLLLLNLSRKILIRDKKEPIKPFPEHLYFYTDKTIGTIVERAGLNLVNIRVEGFSDPQRFNANIMESNWKTALASFFLRAEIDVKIGLGSFIVLEAAKK